MASTTPAGSRPPHLLARFSSWCKISYSAAMIAFLFTIGGTVKGAVGMVFLLKPELLHRVVPSAPTPYASAPPKFDSTNAIWATNLTAQSDSNGTADIAAEPGEVVEMHALVKNGLANSIVTNAKLQVVIPGGRQNVQTIILKMSGDNASLQIPSFTFTSAMARHKS